jgi:DNA-binding GntR family transcriptional regulator
MNENQRQSIQGHGSILSPDCSENLMVGKMMTNKCQQQAYEYVRKKILSMEFMPGEYITDSRVASELNISRTPVREAFQRLENDSLLISEVRRGWRVYSMSLKDIDDIFDIKCAVEGLMARKAAMDQNEEHHQILQDIIQQMRKASNEDDVETWFGLDASLHHLLYVMAQNERAERIIRNLNDQWHRLRRGFIQLRGRLDIATDEHDRVISAITNHDPDRAEQAMQDHLNDVRRGLMKVLVAMILPYARDGL